MLNSIVYDLERFGLRFVASPRHADVLMVTGPMTRNMHEALLRTWSATPDPKWVVAVGDCAIDGGVFKGSYAISGGVDAALPVDLVIRGCPPTPRRCSTGCGRWSRRTGRRNPHVTPFPRADLTGDTPERFEIPLPLGEVGEGAAAMAPRQLTFCGLNV